ncbi:MAG: 50S ribosomal protein L24 [bacterium]|nr:50S ribosomal protein L24 [bacterium]
MHIRKGDKVKILSGKDRGKSGTVLKVFSEDDAITVEGINLYKKRSKPKKQGQKGETLSVPRPMHVSSVMLVCGGCKQAARFGNRMEGKSKIRYCKKCNAAAT